MKMFFERYSTPLRLVASLCAHKRTLPYEVNLYLSNPCRFGERMVTNSMFLFEHARTVAKAQVDAPLLLAIFPKKFKIMYSILEENIVNVSTYRIRIRLVNV